MDKAANSWQRYLVGLATFVVVILVVACLYWARSVLIPVALSILLTFVLAPVVSRLQQVGLGRTPAVLLVVTLVGLLVLGVLGLMTAQLAGLVTDLPNYQDNIAQKIRDLQNGAWTRFVDDFERFLQGIGAASVSEVEPQPVRIVPDDPVTSYASMLTMLNPLLEPLVTTGLVVVLVIFMLINREDLRNRVVSLAGPGRLAMTTKALDEAGNRLSRYLLMQLIINGSYGIGVAVGLLVLGVPYAPLWGLLAAVLRYIPYLGPWLAALMPLALAIAVFDGWGRLLVLIGFFVVLELFSNMVMEPLMYGQSIGVSEASLLVAVAFWTWLWGAVGLVLAVPLTVCLVVMGKYVPALRIFDVLLGERAPISPDAALYHRLLAQDGDEGLEIVQEQLKSTSRERIADEMLLPCLIAARRDLASDQIEADDYQNILKGLRELIVELGADQNRNQESATPADDALDGRPVIVACPVRDEGEEVALHLLPQLTPATVRTLLIADESPITDLLAAVEEHQPVMVCLASLPPGGLATTALLCRRLHARFPDVRIVVWRWGDRNAAAPLKTAGADQVVFTLQEVLGTIHSLTAEQQPQLVT